MSVLAQPPPAAAAIACASCGAALHEDQEWCLECGAARTLIHGAPGWRIPFAVIGTVVALVLTGVAIALLSLSSDANREAATRLAKVAVATVPSANPTAPAATAPAPSTTATTTPAGSTSTPATTPAAIPAPATSTPGSPGNGAATASVKLDAWPLGLGGWTVVLASSRSRAAAEARARQIGATGIHVGVLNSTDHPSMTPAGYWVVFSDRWPDRARARAAAARLKARGEAGAHARMVGPS